jgi:hypothetical protein
VKKRHSLRIKKRVFISPLFNAYFISSLTSVTTSSISQLLPQLLQTVIFLFCFFGTHCTFPMIESMSWYLSIICVTIYSGETQRSAQLFSLEHGNIAFVFSSSPPRKLFWV